MSDSARLNIHCAERAGVAEVHDPMLEGGSAGLFVEDGCFSLVGELGISAAIR